MNMSNTNGFPFYASASKTEDWVEFRGMNESSLECKIVFWYEQRNMFILNLTFFRKRAIMQSEGQE